MNLRKLFYSTAFAALLCSLPLFCRIIFGSSPSTHPEANCFIMHYNSGQPLAKMIFDPLRTDWANYQARELSYVLDYFDARFIAECIKSNHAHFYSLSAIVLLIASAALIHKKLKTLYPDAHPVMLLVPPLFYVCSFMNEIGFFRSAKPTVSFLLIGIFFTFAGILKAPEKYQSFLSLLAGSAALLIIPGFDRIGFFIAAVVAAAGASLMMLFSLKRFSGNAEYVKKVKKPLMILSLSALASVIISLIYNFHIAPKIVMALNNYHVAFNYQTFKTEPRAFVDGMLFILTNFGGLFQPAGDIIAVVSGITVLMIMILAAKRICENPQKILIMLALGGIFAVSVICSAMMIARHPVILDLPHGAYFQVFGTAFIGIFAIILLESADKTFKKILLVLAAAGCITPILRTSIPATTQNAELELHQVTTGYTIELLNNPDLKQEKILPTSSCELINYFRSK